MSDDQNLDSQNQDEQGAPSQNNDDQQQAGPGNAAKDPDDWTTGDEPATPAQKSYLSTMAVEAGESVPQDLTKADASKMINELQEKTGRDTNSERP